MVDLNSIVINPKEPAHINYVRARCAIEETFPNREQIRSAKMAVIEHLQGTIKHPSEAAIKKHGATKMVVFPDNTKAKF